MNIKALAVGASIASAAAGFAAGYFFARRQLELKYATIAEEEIDQGIRDAREYFARFHKKEEYESPITAAAALIPVKKTKPHDPRPSVDTLLAGLGYKDAKEALEGVVARGPGAPYIIRADEFLDNESGYDQVQLTYFEGDDTLCDERDEIFQDVERFVGSVNLQRFGHLSNDENVVYIRNDKMEVEYEIVRGQGTYKEIVAGL